MSINPEFFRKIKNGDLQAFESLYREYYKMLCVIADNYVTNKFAAEEIVGDVFYKIWEKRESLSINISIKSYLIRSVRNRCINYLEQEKSIRKINDTYSLHDNISENIAWAADYPLGKLFEEELYVLIQNAIDTLPEQCKNIFILSRDEELSYDEIAQKLGISINTVKTQMKIALSKLRERLKDYL